MRRLKWSAIGKGTCVRECPGQEQHECVDNTTSSDCFEETVFPAGKVRCPVKISWYQELNHCGIANEVFKTGLKN